MHNSKIKQIITSVIFCIVLVGCISVANYFLVPVSAMYKNFERYRNFEEPIEILFLGNSLTGDSIDKETVDSVTGLNSFVYKHQGTCPEILYYLLLDVYNKHKIKKLVCDWDIIQVFRDPPYNYPHKEEIYREFFINSVDNSELYKITLKNIAQQRYTSSFFLYSSFPENITEIKEVLKSKKDYKNKKTAVAKPLPQITARASDYIPGKLKDVVIENSYKKTIENEDIKYICLIRDFCNTNGIELKVVSYPIPQCVEEKLPEMKEYRQISAKLFDELQISYTDASNIDGVQANENFRDAYGHFFADYKTTFTKKLLENMGE